jgi:hypothetical protein
VKQRWVDLSAHGFYLGDQRMADGTRRLILLDMEGRANPAQLREFGFAPLTGAPKYDRDIYVLLGEEQSIPAKALARAIGIERCPQIDVEAGDIQRVFRERIQAKFAANVNALMLRAQELGFNKDGVRVFESAAGRFLRHDDNRLVTEDSRQGRELRASDFLRVRDEADLAACAEGFFQRIRTGTKAQWPDLVQFGRVIHGLRGEADPSDAQMFALQEALEAASYRVFLTESAGQGPSRAAFDRAQSLYYGLPVARMRSATSVAMQQFSTPLPLSVLVQHVLVGHDNTTGKVLLEPTAGHAGLTCVVSGDVQRCAVELDGQRFEALKQQPGLAAVHGDAVHLRFSEAFHVQGGFDYVIANPPFGAMPAPRTFGPIKSVTKLDHYIALRALADRKAGGRAVFILGADSPMSDGTIKGASKSFYNYLHDHYEIHGFTEVDGRLYARQGSAYNVRVIVVGDRRPVPAQNIPVPEKLPIVTDYDELWSWAEHTIERYAQPRPIDVTAEDHISVGADAIDAMQAMVRGDAPAVVRRPVVERAASATFDTSVPPWYLTRAQWEAAHAIRGDTSAIDVEARAQYLAFLAYGVREADEQQLALAHAKVISLSREDVDALQARLSLPVTHQEVVRKALSEDQPVPSAVLADYPDLLHVDSAPAMEVTEALRGAEPIDQVVPPVIVERRTNAFQVPYQAASKIGESRAMIPINMAGATYAALNELEQRYGPIDDYVADRLQYDKAELIKRKYFDPEQIDALGLAIRAIEEGRGAANADQTGFGKGRFGAAMLRYARLHGHMPVFVTISPSLFTDIFRDLDDIGSSDLFKKVFILNDGESIKRFGTEDVVRFPATSPRDRKAAIEAGAVPDDTDLVLASYSQFARAYERNPKAQFLSKVVRHQNGMLALDESHVASGESNLGVAVQEAVANSRAVVYLSATPIKGVKNFGVYNKIFPRSVDLKSLPETLAKGGEALQEAISTNMARDGVLIRREHDFSKLTFHTHHPSVEREAFNVDLANKLAVILSRMSFLSGDVAKEVAELNKQYNKDWDAIPGEDRQGQRMAASSMNFGSRLYSINRQFLLGLSVEEGLQVALDGLANGRKPVFAVENTGQALLLAVLSRRLGMEETEEELEAIKAKGPRATVEELARRDELARTLAHAMKGIVLDDPPQFRELLELMLDRISSIKVMQRYGDYTTEMPQSRAWHEESDSVRALIHEFPDLPLAPLDVLSKRLADHGYTMGEVSGRTMSLKPNEADPSKWDVHFHERPDGVAMVAGFQNGRLDAIAITRAGSTGISLHATDRFADSDIRQREFIVLQRAANIAEFLQWLGRVNRKGQVVTPIIASLLTGLPAEVRLSMMHNAKLRKLSANTTSNRQNADMTEQDMDLLNDVGDQIAVDWLFEHPDVAHILDIDLPKDDEGGLHGEAPYINKLMGRLMMLPVDQQRNVLKELSVRFVARVEEMDQLGTNPFKVDVYEWGAKAVKEEELNTGVLHAATSSFDEPVKMVTLHYEQTVYPIRSDKLSDLVAQGMEEFAQHPVLGAHGSMRQFKTVLSGRREEFVRGHLPIKLRVSDASVEQILAKAKGKDAEATQEKARKDGLTGALNAKERADWLVANIASLRPGIQVTYNDAIKGERKGFVTSVDIPAAPEDWFLLSQYRLRVAFPGEERLQDMSLATLRAQDHGLSTLNALDPARMDKLPAGERFRVEMAMEAFDDVSDGVVLRSQLVLQGNIFRACEMGIREGIGVPMLFTDAEGNRQRAVMLRGHVTPEMVKAIPVALDAHEAYDYVCEYLNPDHPDYANRLAMADLRLYNTSMKNMKKGDGIALRLGRNQSRYASLSMILETPGTNSRAGRLLEDGSIFDLGKGGARHGLGLDLNGSRNGMQATVPMAKVAALLQALQRNHHVGKFYVPEPETEILNTLKARYASERGREADALTPAHP